MSRRWLLVAILAIHFSTSPAHADDASTHTGQNSFVVTTINATNGGVTPELVSDQDSTGVGVTYSQQPDCSRGDGITGSDFYGCGERVECGNNGHVYLIYAHYPDGSSQLVDRQCFEPGEEPSAANEVTPGDVLEAFRRIPVPESEVTVQPPGGETLVNLDTVFSTEAEGFVRTIGLLGHRVELDVWASEFRWVQGDGSTQVTDWSGRPWRKGADLTELITHRYDDTGRGLDVRVDTTWSARYRVDGGPWRDVPGTVVIEGEPFDLTVLSADPKLTG
jgi:hypothetical protein